VSALQVTAATITPVAFRDPPLLNRVGVHEPFALRAVLELETDAGVIGLGETYGDAVHLERLQTAAAAIVGIDVFALNELRNRVAAALAGAVGTDRHRLTGTINSTGTVDRVFSPFEVACLDAQGRAIGRPVCDLLGGPMRDRVPFSAYLFYKWARHPGEEPDEWGAALDPEGVVAQARKMIGEYGFSAIKLKGGVFSPKEEAAAILALREAFPDYPLRLDPNGLWSVRTAVEIGNELGGTLEYLEDPTSGIDAMSEVGAQVPMPLATNMCIVDFDHLPEGIEKRAVGVVLSDHHFWGGLTRSRLLAGVCGTFGLGLSMHSNSHLGISLAAMTHLGAASPELSYACDTHWPWKAASEDVVVPGVLEIVAGAVAVPPGPGLGVELDRDNLARLHEQYVRCGIRTRDDGAYMRTIDPDYDDRVEGW
jgi:glucarate dehydratase